MAEDLAGIRIEESRTYFIQREDVGWTDAEWQDAVRAARANDTEFEGWDAIPYEKCLVEGYTDAVHAEGDLPEDTRP